MTHTSRANEDVSGGVADNESLEFLGDAVLGFVDRRPAVPRVSRRTTKGRSRRSRRRWSRRRRWRGRPSGCALGDHLLLGRGEEKTGGRRKQALLADGYEALIAAIYLDGGIEQARAFIVARVRAAARRGARATASSGRTTSRRCRSFCRRATGRCRSTGWPGRSVPITASCFRWKCVVGGEPLARRRAGRARKKRSRKRRGWRSRRLERQRLTSDRDVASRADRSRFSRSR